MEGASAGADSMPHLPSPHTPTPHGPPPAHKLGSPCHSTPSMLTGVAQDGLGGLVQHAHLGHVGQLDRGAHAGGEHLLGGHKPVRRGWVGVGAGGWVGDEVSQAPACRICRLPHRNTALPKASCLFVHMQAHPTPPTPTPQPPLTSRACRRWTPPSPPSPAGRPWRWAGSSPCP